MRLFYYLVLIIPLIIIAFPVVILALQENDLALRFLPTISSLLFTLLFLGVLLDLRETLQWGNVGKQIMDKLRGEIYANYKLLKRFIDLTEIQHLETAEHLLIPTKQSTLKELRALASLSRRKLSKESLEAQRLGDYSNKNKDYEFRISKEGIQFLYDGKFNGQFELRRRFLNDIELKYAKFMKPDLVSSLLEIQNCLQDISVNADLFNNIKGKDSQEFGERWLSFTIADSMHSIIGEINKINDQIELFPYEK